MRMCLLPQERNDRLMEEVQQSAAAKVELAEKNAQDSIEAISLAHKHTLEQTKQELLW